MPHIAVPAVLWEQANKAFLPLGFLLLTSAPFQERLSAGSLLLQQCQHPVVGDTWLRLHRTYARNSWWQRPGVSQSSQCWFRKSGKAQGSGATVPLQSHNGT